MRFALLFSLPLVAVTAAPLARAADPAAAQELFERGKRLMQTHQIAEACRAFEESQRLDPGIGTLFHVADCEEQQGRTATAWAAFLEVASEAAAKNEPQRAQVARERAEALEPKLARLTIDPGADRGTAGLNVVRDGVVVGEGSWAVAVPVDPGEHTVGASAPGHGAWQTKVTVAPGGRQLVTVPLLPALGEARAVPATSTTSTTSASVDRDRGTGRGNTQRAIGVAIGAAGLVGAGVGTYFGLLSKSKHDDAASHCVGNTCDAQGVALREDAVRAGNVSTVAFVAGGAAIAGGLLTFFLAPHDAAPSRGETAHAGGSTRIAVTPAGVSLSGSW